MVPELRSQNLTRWMGRYNFHLPILFDDGVRWIARIKRQNAATPPASICGYLLRNEASTYRFLEKTTVPVPKVHEVALDPSNPVHVPYILMDMVPGQPINNCVGVSPGQLRKVMAQLASVYCELAKHPFDHIGSLSSLQGGQLGPVANQLIATLNSNGDANFPGPFTTMQECYHEMISRILELIAAGELYSPWAVDTYLVHRCLLDIVPLLPGVNDRKFYLRHPDDAGFHIMVDDAFNITGIIDWEWASTVPKALAFSSPSWLWDVGAFFAGSNPLSQRELVFADLMGPSQDDEEKLSLEECIHDGRGIQRFSFLLGYEFYDEDFVAYTTMFDGLRKIFDVDGDLTWENWRMAALRRYSGDSRLQALLVKQPVGSDAGKHSS